jgi:hypothetical protein
MPDAGRNLMPKTRPGQGTTVTLSPDLVISGVLKHLEETKNELSNLKKELADATTLSRILKRSLGSIIGVNRIKALKRMLGLRQGD